MILSYVLFFGSFVVILYINQDTNVIEEVVNNTTQIYSCDSESNNSNTTILDDSPRVYTPSRIEEDIINLAKKIDNFVDNLLPDDEPRKEKDIINPDAHAERMANVKIYLETMTEEKYAKLSEERKIRYHKILNAYILNRIP